MTPRVARSTGGASQVGVDNRADILAFRAEVDDDTVFVGTERFQIVELRPQ